MPSTDPEHTYRHGQVAQILGLSSGRLSAATARSKSWGRYVGLGNGSGNYRHYTARQVIVLAALVDTMGTRRSSYLIGDRHRQALIAEVVECPWGTVEVSATTGPLTTTYQPRWHLTDTVPDGVNPREQGAA